MTYKVVDTFNPCITSTLPIYAVYRKRKMFGWKYIGRSDRKDGNDVIYKDFDSIKHDEGEWIEVYNYD